MTTTEMASLFISGFAASISLLALYWAIKSWKETHRPLITARVTTYQAYDQLVALNLVLTNTGNRPAINVRLSINREDLEAALFAERGNAFRSAVENCFSEAITVIENGSEISNSFGTFAVNDTNRTWREPVILNIRIEYEDLDGRKYSNHQPLRIRADEGFAGTAWG